MNSLLSFFPISRYCSVIESRQELKENQAYLLQILETERKAKLQYLQQTDELEAEIKKLKNELNAITPVKPSRDIPTEESEQLRKIKKVSGQSHTCDIQSLLTN
ncbi:hypothetical protein ACTXT7_003650 [Hymenolepis weldensis]